MKIFANEYKDKLENFSNMMVRALLNPLVSKKSILWIEALKCLQELIHIGPFKHSYECMDILFGF